MRHSSRKKSKSSSHQSKARPTPSRQISSHTSSLHHIRRPTPAQSHSIPVTSSTRRISISSNPRGPDPCTLSKRVLSHWFQDYTRGEPVSEVCRNRWFRSHPDLDAYMVAEFHDDFQEYRAEKLSSVNGPYSELEKDAIGSMALSILAFQYPRAELRHLRDLNNGALTPEMIVDSHYGPTGKVVEEAFLEANYTAIQMLHPLRFDTVERAFFFLPLTQLEHLNPQKIAVARFSDLVDEAPRMHRPYLTALREFALNHLDVIQRFGRFPQRNFMLARETTPDEHSFLQTECAGWEDILMVDPYAAAREAYHAKDSV